MSIRKGSDWGSVGPLESGSAVVDSDRGIVLAALAGSQDDGAQWPSGTPQVGLTAGDLHRTVGSPEHTPAELYAGVGMKLPVDIGEVYIGTSEQPCFFSAHLVCTRPGTALRRRSLFAGHTLVIMNAAFIGTANLAPRSHPGDGRLDVTRGSLGFVDRMRARRRMPTGTHVPHPELEQSRITEATFDFDSPMVVHLDGAALAMATTIRVRCIPDAVDLVV